ncbi:hypothetical protein DM01DRAFT_1336343 [Hesseltinella vesiculosa]|uniref:Monopolin complex subunit Csm1/Pcs1 C-terminal domain-containing protein n=1 Tax=Hesseltinella vesiculosa TaxID=101127 RepID=A0A1X2GGG7_9FUNG|nr:hypothetical protein DM01DRAFT_1336343 [Hesseltinella vesiculosa]
MDQSDNPKKKKRLANESEDLVKENELLRKRVQMLEERAVSAENGFVELSNLRYTDAEKSLKEYKEVAQRRFDASDEETRQLHELTASYEQHAVELRQQLDSAKDEITRLQEIVTNPPAFVNKSQSTGNDVQPLKRTEQRLAKSEDRVRSLQAQLAAKNELFYKITGIDIKTSHTERENDVHCELQGRVGRLHFRLDFSNEAEGNVSYIPLLGHSDRAVARLIPEDFRDTIDFTADQCPMFIWRLLTAINKKEHD